MPHKLFSELKSILKFILPQKKKEIFIFLSLFIVYFSLGLYLAFNSYLLDFPPLLDEDGSIRGFLYDPYFSYDANHYYHQGYQNIIGHPMVQLLLFPFLGIGYVLSSVFGTEKAKTVFFIFCTAQMIALSVVYVHRYLERVVEISGGMLNLLVVFFAFFSTNLILSFTFESFCFSAFLLSLSCTYYSMKIKKQENTSFLVDAFFAISLGGITLTNFAKSAISIAFSSPNIKRLVTRVFILGSCLLVALLSCMFVYDLNPLSDLSYRMDTFAGGTGFRGNLLERLIDSFWGSPILLPAMRTDIFPHSEDIWHTIIDLDFYHGWWQYFFTISLGLIVAVSFLMNIKNKFVLLLACLFGVDLIIHLGLAYGTKSLYLYGSHWVYVIPMALGWLYKVLNVKRKKILLFVMIGLTFILIVNNAVYLKQFIDMVLQYFSTPVWNV